MDVRLVMFRENGERKEFPLGEGMTLIGRQDDCDLRIPLGEISRRHAQLIIHEGAVTIRDMGSANGTYVNNHRVAEQELTPGDHVVIGPVVFTVQINGEPPVVRQVKTRLETRAPAPSQRSQPADSSAATEISELDADEIFGDSGGSSADPISALEALAASGEQDFIDDILDDEEDKPKKKG